MKKQPARYFKLDQDEKGNLAIYQKIGKGKFRKACKRKSKPISKSTGILHVTAGLENLWEPTPEEMDQITLLFQTAMEHPGSVVVTRNGISVEVIE